MSSEKAVAVAWDVLQHLDSLRLEVMSYIKAVDFPEVYNGINYEEDDLGSHVEDVQKYCEVCCLGACILSKARLYDSIPIRDVLALEFGTFSGNKLREEGAYPLLNDVFDRTTLDLMEIAFERRVHDWNYRHTKEEERQTAKEFGFKYATRKECVKAVMENVIFNQGVFRPEIEAPKIEALPKDQEKKINFREFF